jgi:hypothetical protein
VKVLNFRDPSMVEKLRDLEAKNPRKDDRDWVRDQDDPTKRDGMVYKDPKDNPDWGLPPAVKTGATPTLPALRNAVNELASGGRLNQQRLTQLRGESNKKEKRAAMGAFIDLLIDAHKGGNRNTKHNISRALYDVFDFLVYKEWDRGNMVYELSREGQDDKDIIIRRWVQLYNVYLKETSAEDDKPE